LGAFGKEGIQFIISPPPPLSSSSSSSRLGLAVGGKAALRRSKSVQIFFPRPTALALKIWSWAASRHQARERDTHTEPRTSEAFFPPGEKAEEIDAAANRD